MSGTIYIVGRYGWSGVPPGAAAWGVNNCYPPAAYLWDGVSGWFQMHSQVQWRRGRNTTEHVTWLKQTHDFPIYMQERVADVPASVAYPLEEAAALWPRLLPGPIFSDSFCYMIALAILQKRERIALRGVWLLDDIEAYTETEGLAYWIAIAAQHGITVDSDGRFLQPFRYGYDERLPHPLLPDKTAGFLVAMEHPGARKVMNRWRRKRREDYGF